jgi:hypothetical protein
MVAEVARLMGRTAFWSSAFFLLVLPWVPIVAEGGLPGR